MNALISVSNISQLSFLVKALDKLNINIISTGGTYSYIQEKLKIKATKVSQFTNFPEILEGRVKTLHPNIHGGLLYKRDNPLHKKQISKHKINPIDIAIINLYPFEQVIQKKATSIEEIIENIDIGGPAMIRSAAKNFTSITIITDPNDYKELLSQLNEKGETSLEYRKHLAAKAYRRCAEYDTIISDFFDNKLCKHTFPEKKSFVFSKKQDLRYGENPSQKACFYTTHEDISYSIANIKQHQGKELSYNNIQDANTALETIKDFQEPCMVAVKHLNPCGFGLGKNITEVWENTYLADSISIFGGIIATNQTIDGKTAKAMSHIFLELVLAPFFTQEALNIFHAKKNLRIIQFALKPKKLINTLQLTSVRGGLLLQTSLINYNKNSEWQFVTKKKPTPKQMFELAVAWKLVRHVKSNAILLFSKNRTTGIGAGQMNRVGAAKIAIEQAKELSKKSVLASDAFFPMPDSILYAAKKDIKAIIQPGGSIKDKQIIDACNKHGIAMVFTNERVFKH